VRPHSSLNGLTPAQVAGLNLTEREKKKYLLVAYIIVKAKLKVN
ncbi:MAG: transposase, partial [Tissierellia bacterium]|nr:transposase [Tissierellia bacterium]